MSLTEQPILSAALAFPPDRRAAVADHRYESQGRSGRSVLEAWIKEGENRLDAYQRGELETIPVQDVFQEFRD